MRFRQFSIAALTALLLLASGVARAGVSVSLAGPASVGTGQMASFDLHLEYTPMDLSGFYSGNGLDDYANLGVTSYSVEYAVVSAPACFSCLWDWHYLDLQPSFYPVLSYPIHASPYERTYSLSTVINAPGNYSLLTRHSFTESVLEFGSDLCYGQLGSPCDALSDQMNFTRDGSSGLDFRVTAVPEPETWALLLAGLGLLGFQVMRRKQGQQAATSS